MNNPPSGTGLPSPGDDARQHGLQVARHLESLIAQSGGRISFETYMSECLYAPGLGYYAAGSPKLGPDGDFVTAPEISPLFSRCLARQCAQILHDVAGDTLLEFGAGRGVMAADMLEELAALDALPLRYLILEPSPDLRAVQQNTLSERGCDKLLDIEWLSSLPESPFNGVVVANEVIDAMPVCRFRFEGGEVQEEFVRVDVSDDKLSFVGEYAKPETANLADKALALTRHLAAEDGAYDSEFNRMLAPWVRSVSSCLNCGAALLIDYGYTREEFYHPQRRGGTLMCHFRHHAHSDPYFWPGLQDLTTHVDFTAVAEAGVAAEMNVDGYTTQAQFLLANGLAEMLHESDISDTRAHLTLTAQVKKLTLPDEMGDRFKVMALGKNLTSPLQGFALRDFTDRL